MKELFL